MPTSLAYIVQRLEAVHLGDLLRIWVRFGVKIKSLTRIFKGQKKRTGHHKTAMLYGNNIHISARSDSMEFVPNKEERTLPRASPSVSGFVCVTALGAETPISASEFGNINPIPFR